MSERNDPIRDEWNNAGELSAADKRTFDAAVADYARSPDTGSPWDEVKARVEAKLRRVTPS